MWMYPSSAFGDPGPCPVDDAPHTTCTAPSGPIVIPQTPMRDANVATELAATAHAQNSGAGLAPESFTTATYRRQVGPKARR